MKTTKSEKSLRNRFKAVKKVTSFILALMFISANTAGANDMYAANFPQDSIKLEIEDGGITDESVIILENLGTQNNLSSFKNRRLDSSDNQFEFGNISEVVIEQIEPSDFVEYIAVPNEITVSVEGECISANDRQAPYVYGEEVKAEEDLSKEPSASYDINEELFNQINQEDFSQGRDSQIMAAAALPDYVVSSLTYVNPYPFSALGKATFSVTVRNNGSASLPNVGISCAVYVDNAVSGYFFLNPLPASSSAAFNMSIEEIPEGIHSIKITINDDFYIAESNTSNNSLAQNFSWTGQPNLVVSVLSYTASLPTVGVPVTFNYTVANTGNGKAAGTFYTDVRLDGVLMGTVPISNLGAGYSASSSFELTFYTKKSYTISMKADCNSNVSESVETDNTKTLLLANIRIAPNITVKGALRYGVYQNAGNRSPIQYEFLKNYTVKIYDRASQTLKATAVTNNAGAFSVTVPNNTANDGCEIYFEISMDSNYYARIMPQSSSSAYTITYYTDYKCQEPTLDFETVTLDSNDIVKGVMNIYHWIKKGKEFYSSTAVLGSVGTVDVKWEPWGTEGSYLSPQNGALYIVGNYKADQYDSDILLHEYGHYVMSYNQRFPSNSGDTHTWFSPSLGTALTTQTSTAYTEAYAHFISTQTRGSQTVYDHNTLYTAGSDYFGGDLNTLIYTQYGDSYLIGRQTPFFHNARMELFTAGAMNKLASIYGFNKVNSTVMSATRDNSIDFYDAFMANSANKVGDWYHFDSCHSAFDYELPKISISKSGNLLSAVSSDNIGIPRIEWYIDAVYQGIGSTCAIPSGLSALYNHLVEARAYDYEGNARNYMIREDITGRSILRSGGFGYDFLTFPPSAAQSSKSGAVTDSAPAIYAMSDKLPEQSFITDNMFTLSNTGSASLTRRKADVNGKLPDTKSNAVVSIDADTDLYLTGAVFAAIDGIDLIDENGDVSAAIKRIYDSEYAVMPDLPAGKYTLNIRENYDFPVPYSIKIFAVPSVPELDLPKYLTDTAIEINNPYENKLIVESGGSRYTVEPNGAVSIPLAQGDNSLTYYSQRDGSRSEITASVVFVDSIPPDVIITRAVLKNGGVMISGTVSEYVSVFKINGEEIMLGEFNIPGSPIDFGHFFSDAGFTALDIEAVDYLGHSFNNRVNLIR